jgi:universal stress protein E
VRWLLEDTSGRCTLIHSRAADEMLDPDSGTYETRPTPSTHVLEDVRAELRGAGIRVDLEVSEERAWQALLRAVVVEPCDLVLVGKRALVDAEGPYLGSTAAKLMRKCPSAVWAVRPGSKPPPSRVLAATDLSPVGEKVLWRAGQVAQQAGAPLHVVHALQLSMEAQLGAAEATDAFVARERGEAHAKIRAELRAQGFSGDADIRVGFTSPSRAILECVERFAPDLVVMGTISRSGVPGLLLGNTAERLLARLDTSLLTLKPSDFVCPVRFGR